MKSRNTFDPVTNAPLDKTFSMTKIRIEKDAFSADEGSASDIINGMRLLLVLLVLI